MSAVITEADARQTSDARPAERYAAGLTAIDSTREGVYHYSFAVIEGRRFDKVVSIDPWGSGKARSVHAFVERETGHVYKAESWSKPAKGVRFATVEDALAAASASRAAFSGGYLYR